MAPMLNRWRLGERVLLIFAPVRTPNGDREAFVTAHALPKEHDHDLPPDFEPTVAEEMSSRLDDQVFFEGAAVNGMQLQDVKTL
jgi:hypothetical protein